MTTPTNLVELLREVEFLCARLRELENSLYDSEEAGADYYGHVAPSLARVEMQLAALQVITVREER